MSIRNIDDLIEELKGLTRYHCTTTWYDDPDMEEDSQGGYVSYYTIERIIKELEDDL